MSITPDGTSLIVRESTPGSDLMLLTLAGEATLKPLVKTTFVEQNGEISPDGRWLAYESNESGEFEIYVRPFPGVERGRWQVSNGGGTQPLWSRDGAALYFVSWSTRNVPERSMMVVSVEKGAAWRNSPPQRLPVTNPNAANPIGGGARSYDIGIDGRFLMLKPSTAASPEPVGLVIVLNWLHDLQRLAVQ
jgi:serine/threonine-protein kinase